MKPNLRRKLLGFVLAFLLCFLGTADPVQSFASLPDELRLISGQQSHLDVAMPVQALASVDRPDVLQLNGSPESKLQVSLKQPLELHPQQSGKAEVSLKLFGKIPLKTVHVNVVPELKVIPGGQTIGVKVKSSGILVVGHHLVRGQNGAKVSPGEAAGLKLGDLLTTMDGNPLDDVSKVAAIVEKAGKAKRPLDITFRRSGKEFRTKLSPAYDQEDQSWRLGLYIRDSAAGVGTLTFYAPHQKVYGALGHVITDMNTQTAIEVGSGQIVQSNVTSISRSEEGEPGEKRATFTKDGKVLGNVERNTHFGIFGKMNQLPEHGLYQEPIPVGLSHEVKEGPAEILTVVEGQKVERYTIEIVHVSKQDAPATKGMVLRITDPRLLKKTGGIVQGMSGSPIVQDGRLIGAVTHVFVNDPKSGYGCFIEWMLQDSGILQTKKATPQNLKAG
ncbi:serine peptidase [Bacillus sp. FJAT-18019]|uniref:Serine peptidase n=1 Tax=Paenibacillus solani TaxID=1705565 RepID=A0A0M1P2E0_9BACL|nr:SpoIVB peptidase [Paenibacillus solani]KOP63917.1 serine peptidase [Bacillus sp. FJAT-18019]KOR88663.1 serine peptidase [Paenibacillus solani]